MNCQGDFNFVPQPPPERKRIMGEGGIWGYVLVLVRTQLLMALGMAIFDCPVSQFSARVDSYQICMGRFGGSLPLS